MDRAKVSAVIPVYNCERYIGEAIESVLTQTYPAHEIVVVDDGSTDGTRRALEPYMGRILYIHQEKRGVAAARNQGIDHASGDYIAFLDADDLWLAEKLQLQMAYLEDHPECDLVYSDMKTFDENGIIQESVKIWLNMSPPSGWIFKELFWETLFAADATVFAKKCIDRVGPFDESLVVGEDYNIWLRMARRFQIGYLDVPLTKYRQHASMTTRRVGRCLKDGVPWEVIAVKKVLELYPKETSELGESTVRKRISRPYYFLGCDRLKEENHREARKLFACALRYWPTNRDYQMRYLATFFTPSQVSVVKNLYHKLFRVNVFASSPKAKEHAPIIRPLTSSGERHAK
jgi:glycosyltransferase involved in cell wall biosynthesis